MAWEAERRRPQVVLCLPHKSEYVTLEWAENYNRLLLPPPFHIEHRRGPLPIDRARNALVEDALKLNPDYVLFWDDDVLVPKDAVYQLLSSRYPITSILYPDKPGRAACFNLVNGRPEAIPWDFACTRSFFADAVGFGMVMIDARVFKLAKEQGVWPPFEYLYDPVSASEGYSEDQYFCIEVAKKLGFSILVKGKVHGAHVFSGKLIDNQRITYLGI